MKFFKKKIITAFAALVLAVVCAVGSVVVWEYLKEEPNAEKVEIPKDVNNVDGFVLLSEVVPDVIEEVRYYSTFNFVGERIDGYSEPCILVTKEAAEALKKVNDYLIPKGYRLKVFDGYRPQSAVDHFVRWSQDSVDEKMKQYFYPDIDKQLLFSKGYIAAKSGHSRGSTVDLTLFDMKSGRDVDMGGGFDFFGEISHYGYTGNLSAEQIQNRKILRDVMTMNGFRAIDNEWWHFTLENEPYPDTYFDFQVTRTIEKNLNDKNTTEKGAVK